ncbi:hypothetical protein Prudu_508S000500 [Prunus dulcis]|uniref:Uncharacterized protein n=1 Tax=Prunus dulcis TaxID=3755 RepID=A0A5H2XKH1_PRUDU|nr:hypothetical protein Prudu_508S000500 [Prunus dulcis]
MGGTENLLIEGWGFSPIRIFESTMRTNNKCTEVGASHEGSVARRPQLQRVRKVTLQRLPQARKKRMPAKRISGPMGNGVFGVRVFIPRDRNPCSPLLHFDLEEHISFKLTLKKSEGVETTTYVLHDLLAGERRVPYESLCTPYWKKNPKDDKEADQIARAFILCLIGSSFLNDKSNTGRSSSMGGYWRAWEVWACEYLKPFALSRPSGTLNTWPRTLRWVGAKSKRDLQHHLEHFRVMMRHLTNDQVNWNPWGTNESDMPEAVINSVPQPVNESYLRDQLVQPGFWESESQCKV